MKRNPFVFNLMHDSLNDTKVLQGKYNTYQILLSQDLCYWKLCNNLNWHHHQGYQNLSVKFFII